MRRSTIGKSALVTGIAILATCAIALPVRLVTDQPVTWINWVMWFVIPGVISGPLPYRVFRQSAKLAEAYQLLSQAHAELAFRASHDPMTGLWNREYFMLQLNELERNRTTYALLILDADHFKNINDSFGHAEGDQALILISEALRRSSRDQDVVARIGGEEFGVILMEAGEDEAAVIAERMRHAVERIPWVTFFGKRKRLTVSVGGSVGRDGDKSSDVFKAADNQLYEAKRHGRNQVVMVTAGIPVVVQTRTPAA